MLCEGFSLINVRRRDRMKRKHVFFFFMFGFEPHCSVEGCFQRGEKWGEGKRVDE